MIKFNLWGLALAFAYSRLAGAAPTSDSEVLIWPHHRISLENFVLADAQGPSLKTSDWILVTKSVFKKCCVEQVCAA